MVNALFSLPYIYLLHRGLNALLLRLLWLVIARIDVYAVYRQQAQKRFALEEFALHRSPVPRVRACVPIVAHHKILIVFKLKMRIENVAIFDIGLVKIEAVRMPVGFNLRSEEH